MKPNIFDNLISSIVRINKNKITMMKTKNLLTLSFAASISFAGFSQDENKVPNSSFETLETKIKAPGQFMEAVADWETPRDCAAADIYSASAKKEEVAVPDNAFGGSDTQEGENYAGIMVYEERGEIANRMFLATKLSKTLIAGKKYCVKFHVSLADLSKYGINNLGVYLSSSKAKLGDIEDGEIKPQVTKTGNPILGEMGLWTAVCAEYEADGTEKYLTIGNFAGQDDVLTQKMRRPREFNQPQIRGAYYYIDNVSVIATSHLDSPCKCEEEEDDPNDRLQVVYTKNVSENMDMGIVQQISHNKIFFKAGKFDLDEQQKQQLATLVEQLNSDSEITLSIEGHCDDGEAEMYSFDISEKRAIAIKDFLIEEGVSESRLTAMGYSNEEPDAGSGTNQAKAQNRRVEFSATK